MIEYAAAVVREGGVVAYPTEACYGLGCDPRNPTAIRRILWIKRRWWGKGLILIADDFRRVRRYLQDPGGAEALRARESWPGPVTWVLPASPHASRWLRGDQPTIAVRVTDHPVAWDLCRTAGMALVSTSANHRGRQPLKRADAVRRLLGEEVDYILEGRLGRLRRPTEIRDGATGEVLRQG